MILLRNGDLYAPEPLGRMDVLIAGGSIVAVGTGLQPPRGVATEVLDLSTTNIKITPGLIDGHVHLAGAGGEGGPATRTPELHLGQILAGGVTTAVGCLGTDGYTRSVENLLMKAKGLKQEGLSCWIYTGSYQIPPPTLTGALATDLCYVEEVIGAGEIAVADHRSSSPTVTELIKLAKQGRVGGMLGQKAGIIHLHMGDGREPYDRIYRAVERSELTLKQFYPTHVNRNRHIFEASKTYGKKGFLDITTSSYAYFKDEEVKPSSALAGFLTAGVPPDHITMSSDAGGSLPAFGEQGELVRMEIGQTTSLLAEARDAVRLEKLPFETVIRTLTANPAKILKLSRKGRIGVGLDADLLLLDEDFQVWGLLAGGRFQIREGQILRRGTFEPASP